MDDEHSKRFFSAIADEPLLQPVDPASPVQRRLWRACELCTFGEYRIGGCPDPRGLHEVAIDAWSARTLTRGERLGDPAAMSDRRPFWIRSGGERLGTVALCVNEMGVPVPSLELASLYLFREYRGLGHGRRLMERLDALARATGLDAIRLETDWLWQPAVRFYLGLGWWVQNWKHSLRLVYRYDLPKYAVQRVGDRMDFVIAGEDTPLICATRAGERLVWRESGDGEGPGLDLVWSARSSFSLWLALAGWPLIRGPGTWAQYVKWIDLGMPEGLARKIQIFEALARGDGFMVNTPRIPGLSYPDEDAL